MDTTAEGGFMELGGTVASSFSEALGVEDRLQWLTVNR